MLMAFGAIVMAPASVILSALVGAGLGTVGAELLALKLILS